MKKPSKALPAKPKQGQFSRGRFVCSVINGTYKLKLLDSTGSVVVIHINSLGQVFGLTADKT